MGRWRGRLYATDRARDFDHERDRDVRIRQIYETIDRQPFQWVVVLVAGIGFFLDGYTLFASNIALPMISYVYWKQEVSPLQETSINIATLAGTLFGQVLFGVLADKNGRKKMYGIELVVIITATLGAATCSTGAEQSMNVFAWLIWWRIVVGIGVGADYPLSAIITSEFAPTKQRARMMATVFFMQPLGQISGNLISLIVVTLSQAEGNKNLIRSVDIMWRWVIGIGVVPGVVASIFRFVIPETPRFLLDIEDDPIKAEFDATQLFGGSAMDAELEDRSRGGSLQDSRASQANQPLDEVTSPSTTATSAYPADWPLPGAPMTTLNSKWTLSKADILQYFWREGNWRTLLATSLCWLLLDFGFYGIGLSNPQSLARIWGHGAINISGPSPIWMTNDDPTASVYTMFMNTSVQALVILNVGSVTGGLLLIFFADRLNRVSLQKYGFLFVAALFIVLGAMLLTGMENSDVTIALHVISQLAFNFGPNATTYIITGELFPTRYRASCHGISAAMGKLGSILAQVFAAYYKLRGSGPGKEKGRNYGTVLLVFSAAMMVGAVVTHFWIPDVQYKDKKNKTLETLATGRLGRNSQSMTRRLSFGTRSNH